MDPEDFDNIEDYWSLLCEHQDLCPKCFAPWTEHDEAAEDGMGCPD